MSSVKNLLIIGGGTAGMSLAIAAKAAGVAVDLVESEPKIGALGAGITLAGPTMRAFQQIGVYDEIARRGAVTRGLRMYDMQGNLLEEFPSFERDDIPGTGGIMRPVLAEILAAKAARAGAAVRLGLTFERIDDRGTHVDVTFTDGSSGRYDLVVGADGLFSKTRAVIMPQAPKPQFTGQGAWRAVVSRPPEVTYGMFFMGPEKTGFTPISATQMYIHLLEHVPDNPWRTSDMLLPIFLELLAPFGGLVAKARAELGPHSFLHYRPLEYLLLPEPWYRGRVLLVGDAAHGTTPHMASGAGLAVEDAVVLGHLLAQALPAEELLRRFQARRGQRCRMLVQNSVQLGNYEMAHAAPEATGKLMQETMLSMLEPI